MNARPVEQSMFPDHAPDRPRGPLLDTVAHYEHVIDQLTEPVPTYADFAYGANQ